MHFPRVHVLVIALVVDVDLSHACPQCSCRCSGCSFLRFRSEFSVVGGILFTKGSRSNMI